MNSRSMRQSTWLGLVGLLLLALGIVISFMTSHYGPVRILNICLGCGLIGLALLRRFRDDE